MSKTRKVRVYKKGGNKPCFECGGNVFQQGGPPQEQMMQQPGQEQMMQGPPPQQQQQQPQMSPEELMQQIAQALQQGTSPEEIVQGLVEQMGVPQDQAVQMVTQVIETLKSQQQPEQQQQPPMEQPPMEQGPPMQQPSMEEGGDVFKEHPTDENNFQIRKDNIAKMLKSNSDNFEYDDMIKQADDLMQMSYPQFKLGGEKWMQKAHNSMKKRGTIGSFKEHCGGKVSLDCIKKGLRSKNPKIRKKAGFAKASWKIAGKMQMGGYLPMHQKPPGEVSDEWKKNYALKPDDKPWTKEDWVGHYSMLNTIYPSDKEFYPVSELDDNIITKGVKRADEYESAIQAVIDGGFSGNINKLSNFFGFGDTDTHEEYKKELEKAKDNRYTGIQDKVNTYDADSTDIKNYIKYHGLNKYNKDVYGVDGTSGQRRNGGKMQIGGIPNIDPNILQGNFQMQHPIGSNSETFHNPNYMNLNYNDLRESIGHTELDEEIPVPHNNDKPFYRKSVEFGYGGDIPRYQVAGQPSWDTKLNPEIYQTWKPEDNLYGNINDEQLGITTGYAKEHGVDVEDVTWTPGKTKIKKRLFKPNEMNIDYSLGIKGQGLDDIKSQAQKDFGDLNKDMFDDWDDDKYIKYAEQSGLDYTPSEQGQMTALRNKKQERQNRKDSGVGGFERNFGRKIDGLDVANAATATTGAIAGWAQNDEQNRQRMNTAFASIPGGGGNPIGVDEQGRSGDRGDYMDEGQFRPDQLGPDAYSMKNDASYFAAQKGGNIGDVTYMTDEELERFIKGGGEVEVLDY